MASQFPIDSTQLTTSLQPSTSRFQDGRASILFIDAGVAGASQIAASKPGIEVYQLSIQLDAVEQITQVLAGRSGISSIQIVSHGHSGSLDFASGSLDLANATSRIQQLRSWSTALTAEADILLYGCDVAQDSLGKDFVKMLAQATGADVAASTDLTGFGGNWDLEFQTAEIETVALQAIDYTGTLSTLTVSNATTGNAAIVNTLDWALAEAEKNADADTIVFDFEGDTVINLAQNVVVKAGSNITFKRKDGSFNNVIFRSPSFNFSINQGATAAFKGLTFDTLGETLIFNAGTITELSDVFLCGAQSVRSLWNEGIITSIHNSTLKSTLGYSLFSTNEIGMISDSHFVQASSFSADANVYLDGQVKIIIGSSIVSGRGTGIILHGFISALINTTISTAMDFNVSEALVSPHPAIYLTTKATIFNLQNNTFFGQDGNVIKNASSNFFKIKNFSNNAVLQQGADNTTILADITVQANNYNGTLRDSGLATQLTAIIGKRTLAFALSNNKKAAENLIDKGGSSPMGWGTDQAGVARISGAGIDIGAMEFQLPTRQAIIRNEATGEVEMQFYDGLKLIETRKIYNGSVSDANVMMGVVKDWQLKAIHDFDNDGNADVLWQHTDGSTYIWEMNGNVIKSIKSLFYQSNAVRQDLNAIGSWNIIGLSSELAYPTLGDQQLLLQNTSSGEIYAWKLDGYEVMLDRSSSIRDEQGTILQPGGVWKAIQLGDFNGDGYAKDILFHNQVTGSLGYWATQGNFLTAVKELGNLPVDGSLSIVGVGFYTSNAQKTELMLHDRTTGELIIDRLANDRLGNSQDGSQVKLVGTFAAFGNPITLNDLNDDGKREAFGIGNDGKFTISTLDVQVRTLTPLADSITNLGTALPGWRISGIGQFLKSPSLSLSQPIVNLVANSVNIRSGRTINEQIIRNFYPGTGDNNPTLSNYIVHIGTGAEFIKPGTTPKIDKNGILTLSTIEEIGPGNSVILLYISAKDTTLDNPLAIFQQLVIFLYRDSSSTSNQEVIVRNETTGEIELQHLSGVERLDRQSIYFKEVGASTIVRGLTSDWQLKATHDFTGDRRTDLFWQNSSGKLILWEMDDNVITQSSELFYKANGQTIQLSEMGDWQVMGMGNSENGTFPTAPIVFLQNRGTGEVAVWTMQGKEVLLPNSAVLTYQGAIAKPGKDWKLIQIADFDADGSSDVLLHNQVNGEVYRWIVKNNVITQSVFMGTLLPTNAWSIVSVMNRISDPAGRSGPDLVFHNRVTGELVAGQLEGTSVVKLRSFNLTSVPDQSNLGNKLIFDRHPNALNSVAKNVFFTNTKTGKATRGYIVNRVEIGPEASLRPDIETNLDEVTPGWTIEAIVDTKI